MDCIEEQRVKYAAYKFSKKERRWWYTKRNSLVMELGSVEAIPWTQFKEEFCREYSWSLRRSCNTQKVIPYFKGNNLRIIRLCHNLVILC